MLWYTVHSVVYTCDLILARIWLLGLCSFINWVLQWSRLSPLFQASLGGLGNSYSTNRASGRWLEDPWFHHQYSMGRSGNRLSNIRGSCSYADYAIKEDQEEMAQKEQDVIDRYYFSRYGRNDLNLIMYGERSCFLDSKPRASLGEVL